MDYQFYSSSCSKCESNHFFIKKSASQHTMTTFSTYWLAHMIHGRKLWFLARQIKISMSNASVKIRLVIAKSSSHDTLFIFGFRKFFIQLFLEVDFESEMISQFSSYCCKLWQDFIKCLTFFGNSSVRNNHWVLSSWLPLIQII